MYDRLAGDSRQLEGDELMRDPGSLDLHDRNHRPFGVDRADRMGRPTGIVQVDDGGAMSFQTLAAELSCGHAFDQLAALANTHRVTFYPLKPPVADPSISGLGESAAGRGSIGELELASTRAARNPVASGAYRVVLQVQRDDGSRMQPQHFDFELHVPVAELETAQGQYIAVRSGLLLASGSYRLAVGLWEENSGCSSFVVRELSVQPDPSVA